MTHMNSSNSNDVPSDAPHDIEGGPMGLATANDGGETAGFATARFPMAVQTSVSPVLNMDDLQVVFTTNNDPHK